MTVLIYRDSKIVQSSQNLRGLISRAYRVGVSKASVWRTSTGGTVYVVFADGSWLRTGFADFTIARDFLRSRWRRWGLYAEVRNSDDYWSFI